MLFEILLRLFIFQQLRGSLFPLILRYILKLAGQVIALVDGQFLFVQRLLDSVRGILIDLYDLAHRALTQADRLCQFLSGIDSGNRFRQCCRKRFFRELVTTGSRLICSGLGFNLWF